MATILQLDHHGSDDEDDDDYIPPDRDPGSDPSDDEDAQQSKRVKTGERTAVDEHERAEAMDRGAAIFASFQRDAAQNSTPASQPAPQSIRTIKIEKRYLFAGQEISEVVEVPEDSPEAKKWSRATSDSTPITFSSDTKLKDESASCAEASRSSIGPQLEAKTQSRPALQPTSKKPPPIKRRPKQVLSTGASSTSKPQKLTTLQKSTMDWKAHLRSEPDDDRSRLEANRREGGGGFLEKMEFLQRVDERRETAREEGGQNGKRKR